jgi:hypothetical protein
MQAFKMKSEMKKFAKIMDIIAEMYDENPKYCIDCLFDAYYQFKKKKTIDERSYGDPDLKKKLWAAINLFKHLVNDQNEPPDKAFHVAYRTHGVDRDLFTGVTNSFRAFKSAKKTKFKDLY